MEVFIALGVFMLAMLTCGTGAAWAAGVAVDPGLWQFIAICWGVSAPLMLALAAFIWVTLRIP